MSLAIKYSVKTLKRLLNKLIDEEIQRIIAEQYERSTALVKEKRDFIQRLSERLLVKDVLTFIDVQEVLGERPFKPHPSFKRFLDEIKKGVSPVDCIQDPEAQAVQG
jgi:hypothetical protein